LLKALRYEKRENPSGEDENCGKNAKHQALAEKRGKGSSKEQGAPGESVGWGCPIEYEKLATYTVSQEFKRAKKTKLEEIFGGVLKRHAGE